ncbi:MAG: putative nicotinate-nucleotide adenylyltransferase [Microgenomates group bacterium GW2011_GWF2_45_18]|nr:MAG: putative nicotinate-nucleotide adenylyltransferase [Microgenomates group bacterium GW2011_GWF1_44_10]KKU02168.1 MAG: putative nicotinate-nucleotide adenylyltransferase [Microgenomates group bacterium GW2011_GWF2_45_18]OGJ41605.1 MAG: nicotinate (nicotinamide) nucleotide adenylyltransferase [Candidatus Pacebacteria bacterium RIFOXYB1_FULL_44_10]HAU98718.1 nicotinate (nicotinamide) nucleotide adenylyltransferase [Candidatus Paceibacterota bacterium]HAX01856.1 nicotinate (nicotinamide) nuc
MHILLFGGAFDPPHVGHQTMIEQVLAKKIADEVWFVPSAQHPFAKQMSLEKQRVAMLELLQLPHTKIWKYEVNKKTAGFSFDSASTAMREFPEHTFSWLIGSDQLKSFHRWGKWEELLRLLPFYVYPRKGFPMDPLYEGMIEIKNVPMVDISSTEVRKEIQETGQSDFISEKIQMYITEHELYKYSEKV